MMLKNHDIVYIGNEWFSENKTSSHHIAEILAEKNRILYVEASGQRAPRASKRDIKKIFNKVRKAWRPPVEIQQNVFLFSPVIIPFHRYGLIRWINKWITRLMIKRACRKVAFEAPLLWILLPHYSSVVGQLNEIGTVYYCVDEYSSQPNVNTEIMKKMERHLLEHADVVFAVSEKLLVNKRKMNPNTHLSLHGVDVDHFKQALKDDTEIPADIAPIQRPIAGFFGLIQERVDLGLIDFLSSRMEDVSFVLIGMVAQDISFLKHKKNVYFLGAKPYNTLPHYLKAFDVCMLPYKLNTEMINSNPKKLREYLAGGKPVVSVRIREVERYKELIYIAENYNEFLECISRSLKEDSGDKIAGRLKAMEGESWSYRVEQISRKVNGHIVHSPPSSREGGRKGEN